MKCVCLTLTLTQGKKPNFSYLGFLKDVFKYKNPVDFNLLADGLRKGGNELKGLVKLLF